MLHWGFVVGVPSQPDECWGIKADRELAGRYLESLVVQKQVNRTRKGHRGKDPGMEPGVDGLSSMFK